MKIIKSLMVALAHAANTFATATATAIATVTAIVTIGDRCARPLMRVDLIGQRVGRRLPFLLLGTARQPLASKHFFIA